MSEGVGRPSSPLGNAIDLVLEARALIEYVAEEEVADEIKQHKARLNKIHQRHAEDVIAECSRHREYLGRIESTRQRIAELERQMAAQLSVTQYPRQATPALRSIAYPEAVAVTTAAELVGRIWRQVQECEEVRG